MKINDANIPIEPKYNGIPLKLLALIFTILMYSLSVNIIMKNIAILKYQSPISINPTASGIPTTATNIRLLSSFKIFFQFKYLDIV